MITKIHKEIRLKFSFEEYEKFCKNKKKSYEMLNDINYCKLILLKEDENIIKNA